MTQDRDDIVVLQRFDNAIAANIAKSKLDAYCADVNFNKHKELLKKFARIGSFHIDNNDFHKIKIQLRALGLITKSEKKRSIKDNETYWQLTPYGDTVMTRLIAIRK